MTGEHSGSRPVAARDADYFDQVYADYDRQNPPDKIDFYLRLVTARVPEGARLFELGSGKGLFLTRAARRFACTACDINPTALEQTASAVPGLAVLEGSYELLQTSPGAYDAVVSWDVLEHIPDLQAALEAAHSALRPGGIFAGVVPVYDGPLGWLVHILDKDPTHLHKLARGEWLDRLERAGFVLLERGGILRGMVLGRYQHWTRPQGLLRSCGVALYFVVQKPAT